MNSSILALDVGEKRVGVALASRVARLPHPYATLPFSESLDSLQKIIEQESVDLIVAGLPLNRNEEATKQTLFTEKFIEKVRAMTDVSVVTISEAQSSVRAKNELHERKVAYKKEDVDALAATFILDDYLKENPQ